MNIMDIRGVHNQGPILVKDMQTPPSIKKSRFDLLVQIFEKRSEAIEKRKKKILFLKT